MPGEPGERNQRGMHRRLGYDSHLLVCPRYLSNARFTCVNPACAVAAQFGDCCGVKLDVLFGAT